MVITQFQYFFKIIVKKVLLYKKKQKIEKIILYLENEVFLLPVTFEPLEDI